MKKLLLSAVCGSAMMLAPMATGGDHARADNKFWGALGAGLLGGLIISTIVRNNQWHCHQGLGCHRHGYAGAYHYHQSLYGPILYQQPQPVYQAPPVVVAPGGGYSQAHYQWCADRYRSYDPGSNSYQPYGPYPRRPCVSPY